MVTRRVRGSSKPPAARTEPARVVLDPKPNLARTTIVRMQGPISVLLSAVACASVPRPPPAPAPRATAPVMPAAVDIAKARASGEPQLFAWAPWSKETFARARAEHRFILLHGAAVWCHWCHVMEAITYRDPAVGRLLRDRFIAIRVDIDARPDVAERYGEWGWPATILFSPEAEELGKFRGYLPPDELLPALEHVSTLHLAPSSLLTAEPGAESAPVAALPWLSRLATFQLDGYYDEQNGSWGMRQKAPLGAEAEFELLRGAAGDREAWTRALFTLRQQAQLIDPVWGGVYQYSADGDWRSPHFEKLMPFQAANLAAYAQAFRLSKDIALRSDAESIASYVARFLTAPNGTFYVSQDADVGAHDEHAAFVDGQRYYSSTESERLARGVPDVDRHVYAAENGLMITALCRLFEATGEDTTVASARRAANAILLSHVEADGRVRHDAKASDNVHFLADGAALGRSLVTLFEVTRDARYLAAAQGIANGLDSLFDARVNAYFAHDADPDAAGVFAVRGHPFDGNVTTVRFLHALADATGNIGQRSRAEAVLASISTPSALAAQGRMLGEYLLALREVGLGPAKKDAAAATIRQESPTGG